VNAKNLMLREDVVQAARENKFVIYLIDNIDEAISLLTGITAGELDADGNYPAHSMNFKVAKKLQKFSENVTREKKRN
jgi:predicted ATP-dependent protease